MKQELIAFEQKPVRKVEHKGEMYYSIVDVIEHFTGTIAPQSYWAMLKRRNLQLFKMCKQLKMKASDGEMYTTDAINKAGVLQLLMSIPSPTAEPFKSWLSGVGTQAVAETEDPELGFERLSKIKRATVFNDVPNTLPSSDFYSPLANEWRERGVDEDAFWLLDATILKGTFDLSPTEHKALKGLKQENLRDHMTALELIFNALGEEITRCFIQKNNAQGFIENVGAAQKGGSVAGKARRNFEKKSGIKVISRDNYLGLNWG